MWLHRFTDLSKRPWDRHFMHGFGVQEGFLVTSQTKSTRASYWLLSRDYKRFVSDSHMYVFVSIKEGGVPVEFFIVPSTVVAKKAYAEPFGKDVWYSFTVNRAKPYLDRWDTLR